MNGLLQRRIYCVALPVLFFLLLTGCATTPRVNWDARIGNYTFDQAVAELGLPDRQAALADHTIVAEWLTQRGRTYVHISPGYGYRSPYGYGPGYPASVDTTAMPSYYLRLNFGTDGQLKAWQKFTR